MKKITLLTLIAIVISTAMNQSSVGGPLTALLIVFIAMLAVGIHEARSKDRGAVGSIVSVVVSLIGGSFGVYLNSIAMEMTLSLIHFEGRVIDNFGLSIVFSAVAAIFTVLGSWLALQIVNRFR